MPHEKMSRLVLYHSLTIGRVDLLLYRHEDDLQCLRITDAVSDETQRRKYKHPYQNKAHNIGAHDKNRTLIDEYRHGRAKDKRETNSRRGTIGIIVPD